MCICAECYFLLKDNTCSAGADFDESGEKIKLNTLEERECLSFLQIDHKYDDFFPEEG